MSTWWKRTSRYLSSHSNLFIVTGGIVGGAYLLSQYAVAKFQQIQERLVQDKNAKENLRRRFAQNQEDCTFTVLALLPTLGDQLFNKLNVEQLTESLRTQSNPGGHITSSYNSETETNPQKQASAITQEPSSDGPFDIEPVSKSSTSTIEAVQAEPCGAQVEQTVEPTPSPSSNLNPMAQSFVPGASFAPSSVSPDSTQPLPDAISTPSSDLQSAPETGPSAPLPASDLPINGADVVDPTSQTSSELQGPSTNSHLANGHSIPEAVTPTAPASLQDPGPGLQLNSTPSHLDAQEQRNKILAERQAKLRLWNELKVTAFARVLTSLYCVVLLTLQTHIQLNLIGRFAYLASVEAQALEAEEQPSDVTKSHHQDSIDSRFGLDHHTERLYLTFSWWFLHRGWSRLSDKVTNAIEKVLAPLSVKAQVSMADMRALIADARMIIEHDPSGDGHDSTAPWKRSNFLGALFPVTVEEEEDVLVGAGTASVDEARSTLIGDTKLRALLDETKDIIESDDFCTILRLCLDRVFEVFFDTLKPTFGIESTGKTEPTVQLDASSALESRFQEITEEMQQGKRIRLASLFPLVTRQSQLSIHGVPNEYIENLADSKELRAFSAIIYAAWSNM